MIDELTKQAPVDKLLRLANAVLAMFCDGEIRVNRSMRMSGGALWRLYFGEKDDSTSMVVKRLYGVPFHQSDANDCTIIITCHGPTGIYGALFDRMVAQ